MARPEVVAVGIDECDCFLCRRSVKVGPGCGDDRCGCSVFPAASRTRRASFNKVQSGCFGVFIDVWPGRGADRTAVEIAGGADLFQIDAPFLGGWPPAAAAIAVAQLFPGRLAVFTGR
jgi:hypothetical protein